MTSREDNQAAWAARMKANPLHQGLTGLRAVAKKLATGALPCSVLAWGPHGRYLGHAVCAPVETLADFRALMRQLKIGKARGRLTNWSWVANARDCNVMADLLFKKDRAIGMRRRPGDIACLRFSASWLRRRFIGRATTLRCHLAGVPARARTSDLVQDLLEAEQQIAISVAYLETGAAFVEKLAGRGWRVGEINGQQTGAVNEAVRIAFQVGEFDAVIFTVTEAISLHQNEMLGGERPRALIVHDMRHSAIQLASIEGRCHRDGEKVLIYYAYAEGTIEEVITAVVTRRMASMEAMPGEDASLLKEIADIVQAAAVSE